MHDPTPTKDEAKQAYAYLKTTYEASVIQRRLGLGSSRHTIESIVADPVRRTRLVNWMKASRAFDEQYDRRGYR